MENYKIDIATDFSPKLGVRFKSISDFSGEEFFENILDKKYLDAKTAAEQLHIYLDGASPYGSSFLDESFGKLGRKYGIENVRSEIVFHTVNFKWIVEYIEKEIWK